MFNDEMEIALYAMILGRGAHSADSHDVMDQECVEYIEDVNTDTVTGALREQEDWDV